jgi:hypothetical protein
MDISSLFRPIRDAFIQGVYTETFRDRDNGGPECAEYMSVEFRITVNIILVRLKYFYHEF